MVNLSIEDKRKWLLELSEKDFRNNVIRPLFLALGYEHPREYHGPDELGKDIIFTEKDKMGLHRVIAIQTKAGKLNLTADQQKNAANIATRLKTALDNPVCPAGDKTNPCPNEVILCASGTINNKARQFFNTKAGNIRYLDSEDIIPLVDEHSPKIWQGIIADFSIWYKGIINHVKSFNPDDIVTPHVTDDTYTELRLINDHQHLKKFVKEHGKTKSVFRNMVMSAEQVVKYNDDIFIVSDAGRGKSTLLWRIAWLAARKPDPAKLIFPLFVNAADIVKNVSSPDDFVRYCEDKSKDFSGEVIINKKVIEEGKLLLMVDALDEIPDSDDRNKIIDYLTMEIKKMFPKVRLICTTRPDSVAKKKPCFANPWRIEPLGINQAKKIITHCIERKNVIAKSDANILIGQVQKALKRIRKIHGFELTPLLVTVFAYTAEYDYRDIPANVTELFKKFTGMLLNRWDRDRCISQQYDYKLKDFLLRKIAYSMHRRQITSIPIEEFKEIAQSELIKRGYDTKAEQICGEIIERSRLVRHHTGEISFSHHLLQEFFAGRGIPDIKEVTDTQLNSPWWTRCFAFYFGEFNEDAAPLEKLQKENRKNSLIKHRAIGLSLQACVLGNGETRRRIWKRMIEDIVQAVNLNDLEKELFPIHTMLIFFHNYIKDSLPLSILNMDVLNKIWPEWKVSDLGRLLVVIAFLESGEYEILSEINNDRSFSGNPSIDLTFSLYVILAVQENKIKELKHLLAYIEDRSRKDKNFNLLLEEFNQIIIHSKTKVI